MIMTIIAITLVIIGNCIRINYTQDGIKANHRKNIDNDNMDEDLSNMFVLPDAVTEITSQGYYETIIRLSGDNRNSIDVLIEKTVIFPKSMIIGLVIEKEGVIKFVQCESDVMDIVNVIEKSSLILSEHIKENTNEETLKVKILLLNAKAQYVISAITYIGDSEFKIHISYPENKENDNRLSVFMKSDELLRKIQNM